MLSYSVLACVRVTRSSPRLLLDVTRGILASAIPIERHPILALQHELFRSLTAETVSLTRHDQRV